MSVHIWCRALDAMSTSVTPMLDELHWLAVRCQVDFKMVTLGGLLVTVRHGSSLPGRRLSAGLRQRSSLVSCVLPTQGRVVRRTYNSYGDRCFAAAAPRLWNNLLAHPRQTDINFEQF